MALIKCPECGSEMPSRTEACPKCAHPIAGEGAATVHGGASQTVEPTPKRHRLQQSLAVVLIIGGSIAMFVISTAHNPRPGAEVAGLVVSVAGLFWLIKVRFTMWWNDR
jgi:uncharacterized OB-fold protein